MKKSKQLVSMEIKSGRTVTRAFSKGLRYWSGLSGMAAADCYLIYGGQLNQERQEQCLMGWRSFAGTLPLEM